MEIKDGIGGKSGSGDTNGIQSGSQSRSKIDQSKLAQREAALIKFRQKEKKDAL